MNTSRGDVVDEGVVRSPGSIHIVQQIRSVIALERPLQIHPRKKQHVTIPVGMTFVREVPMGNAVRETVDDRNGRRGDFSTHLDYVWSPVSRVRLRNSYRLFVELLRHLPSANQHRQRRNRIIRN